MNRNYLFGSVSLFVAILAATLAGLLAVSHVGNYEQLFTSEYTVQFLIFDPFAGRLLVLLFVTMVVNLITTALVFSGMFSNKVTVNWVTFSLVSVLWNVLYLASDFTFLVPPFAFMPALIGFVIVMLSRRLSSIKLAALMISASVIVAVLPIVGGFQEEACLERAHEAGKGLVEATGEEEKVFGKKKISESLRVQRACLVDLLWFTK